MPDDDSDFADFLRRIRAGDAAAAEELVRRYEPAIRREVRSRCTTRASPPARLDGRLPVGAGQLLRPRGRRAVRPRRPAAAAAAAGAAWPATRSPDQAARRQRPAARDGRRSPSRAGRDAWPAPAHGPSRVVAGRELLDASAAALATTRSARWRTCGPGPRAGPRSPPQLGGTADGRRMQLARALDRVAAGAWRDRGSGTERCSTDSGARRPGPACWELWQQGQRPDLARVPGQGRPAAARRPCARCCCVDQCATLAARRARPGRGLPRRRSPRPAMPEAALDVVYGEFLLRDELGEAVADEFRPASPSCADLGRQVEVHLPCRIAAPRHAAASRRRTPGPRASGLGAGLPGDEPAGRLSAGAGATVRARRRTARLRDPGRARPGRHGRRLQGPAGG